MPSSGRAASPRRVVRLVAAVALVASAALVVAAPTGAVPRGGLLTADLAITKTDGVTTAVPGGSVTYTITASNAGPDPASATVADTFPAVLTPTWTCVGAGGGTCTAAGSGNISDTVSLPVGASVTFTATASISAAATGTLTNTATVSSAVSDPDPANNSATDTDTLTPQADLAITKTDGVTTAVPGGSVTYTITASNAGPSNAAASTVADTFPAALTVTWTCVGAGGGTCTAAGSGNISDTVNLPAGGSVTYTASAAISASATGSLSNTATVAAPGGVTDPTPGNNSATDTDTLTPQADLEITKTDGVTEVEAGGTLTYTIVASNPGPSNAPGALVTDTFPAELTVTWTCVGAGGGTCTAAGSGNISDTVNLPAGGSVTYTATATISASASGSVSNTATVAAPAGVTDPNPANNSATDTDTVAANAPPVATDDTFVGAEDTQITIAPPGVLANDTDANGDSLTAVLVDDVQHGTLQLSANGTFTYLPDLNFTGTDTFTYVADDGADVSNTATVTITVAPTPGTRNQQFVNDAYQVLLGRTPDPGGLAFWVAQLDGGGSRADFSAGLVHSAEGIDVQIGRAYEALLDRAVDPGGLEFWRAFLTAGGTPQQLDAQLAGSAEFRAGAGGTSSAYVAELYRELLGREADPGGSAFWVAQLDGGRPPVDLAANLLGSEEGLAQQLDLIFLGALGRDAEPAADAAFGPLLTGDRRVVVVIVVASEEFFAKAAPV
jgi:uncharacterized repeat protein (TIGR01451 family)